MKTLFLSCLAILGTFSCAARLTPEGAFTSAPAEVFPLLERNARLDMVDYFRSGLSTPSPNRLDGRSAITELTPEALTLCISQAETVSLSLLPGRNDTIIALIRTLSMPAPSLPHQSADSVGPTVTDSEILFYASDWTPLPPSTRLQPPLLKDWLVKGASPSKIEAAIPFMLTSAVYDPATLTLTFSSNAEAYLPPEQYSEIASSLLPSISYRWDGRRFVHAKPGK